MAYLLVLLSPKCADYQQFSAGTLYDHVAALLIDEIACWNECCSFSFCLSREGETRAGY